jgi:hypothetical protein
MENSLPSASKIDAVEQAQILSLHLLFLLISVCSHLPDVARGPKKHAILLSTRRPFRIKAQGLATMRRDRHFTRRENTHDQK